MEKTSASKSSSDPPISEFSLEDTMAKKAKKKAKKS
jgi:hypothetical protein